MKGKNVGKWTARAAELRRDVEGTTIFEWVPVMSMFAPGDYSRPLYDAEVAKLARNWDDGKVGTLYVSLRPDGKYAIIDGNHRVAAAMIVGRTRLPCRVYIDLSVEVEAELFGAFNGARRNTTPFDIFKADLARGLLEAHEIKDALDELGIGIVGTGHRKGCTRAVASLRQAYRRFGVSALKRTMRILRDAWSDEEQPYSAEAVLGMAAFLSRYGDIADRGRIVERLRFLGPTRMMGQRAAWQSTRPGDNTADAWGHAFREVYNAKLRKNELGPWENRRGERLHTRGASNWD